MKQKALIAMSGGVDSSVAAFLMQEAGYDCMGAIMRLFDKEIPADSETSSDVDDARAVAGKLNMPFHVINAREEFADKVICDFIHCYESGLTPNPCVRCNRHLKFHHFLREAMALGCDCIVTGHYARIRYDEASGRYLLCKALDTSKDQSYVLYCLNQQQLAHTRFPLGELSKEQARTIAEEKGFINARKRIPRTSASFPTGIMWHLWSVTPEKSILPAIFWMKTARSLAATGVRYATPWASGRD